MKRALLDFAAALKPRAEGRAGEPHASWPRYARMLFAALAIELGLVALLILVANPYGNLPPLLFHEHVITDTNQRFQYPAIARSGKFDSAVVGTSTSRLLRPAALEQVFGGRFANLAMDSATPWEQYRMASFFAAEVARPRTLLVGLDHIWCSADADKNLTDQRGFPEWMYDDNPWNDLASSLNAKGAEAAVRRLAAALGLRGPRIPLDGYHAFVPPEDQYDLPKARALIYGAITTAALPAIAGPSPEQRAGWKFPALEWLDEMMGAGWESVILVMTPVHVAVQPTGLDGWWEKECKARIAEIARQRGVPLIDFRIPSDITRRDENYWDPLHYRVPVADRLVGEIARALATGKDDPAGLWHLLANSGN
jgi:hypothetical protein